MKIDGLPRFFLQGQNQETSGLSGFAKGELWRAEVVSQKGEMLTLKTQDGRVISARAQDGTVAEEGDVLRLVVTGRSESGELLVQVRKGALTAHELLKMLKIDADISRDNLALANAFIKAGVAPSRQVMQELSALLGVHKSLTAEQAVFMRQNDMPIDAQTIRAFQAFLQGQNGLGQALTQLGQLLDGLLAELDTVAQSSEQTVPVRAPDEAAARPALFGQERQPVGKAEAEAVQIVKEGPVRMLQEGFAQKAGGAIWPHENAEQRQTVPEAGQPPQAAQTQGAPPVAPRQAQTIDSGHMAPQGQPGQPSVSLLSPAVLPASQTAVPISVPSAQGTQTAGILPTERPPQTDTALSAQQVARQAKALLNALFCNVTGRTAGALSQELAGAKVAKETANLIRFLEANADALPQTARQAAARAASVASGALQLSEQMAPSVTAVPIPVTWGPHQTTAELFIWEDERRKGKKMDPANATLFISLGTAHLGRVETLIQIVGKNVECTLSSDAGSAVTFLARHGDDLGVRLQEEGYRLVRMTTEQRLRPADLLSVQEEHRDKLRRARFDRSV